MNYATKLCIVSMMSVFSVSSMGLVQAADTPIHPETAVHVCGDGLAHQPGGFFHQFG